jgi:hypothetical protein
MIKKDWLFFALSMIGFAFLYEFNGAIYRGFIGIFILTLIILYDLYKSRWEISVFLKKLGLFHMVLFIQSIAFIALSYNRLKIVELLLLIIFITILIIKKKHENHN